MVERVQYEHSGGNVDDPGADVRVGVVIGRTAALVKVREEETGTVSWRVASRCLPIETD